MEESILTFDDDFKIEPITEIISNKQNNIDKLSVSMIIDKKNKNLNEFELEKIIPVNSRKREIWVEDDLVHQCEKCYIKFKSTCYGIIIISLVVIKPIINRSFC